MKIDPSVVAFDIDGVVADTMRLFLHIAKSEFFIESIRYEDIIDYDLRKCLDIRDDVMMEIIVKIMSGDYTMPLRPMADAPRVLNVLNSHYRPTLFVTARPEKSFITQWLCENIGVPSSEIEVVATGSFEGKTEILKERNVHCFVEDRLETCFLLAEAGVTPIVFRQPWNRKPHPFREVSSWREIESLLHMNG